MANLKDLIVTGASRFLGKIYGTITNTEVAEKANKDGSGNIITETYARKTSLSYTNTATINITANASHKVIITSGTSNIKLPTLARGDSFDLTIICNGGSWTFMKGTTSLETGTGGIFIEGFSDGTYIYYFLGSNYTNVVND